MRPGGWAGAVVLWALAASLAAAADNPAPPGYQETGTASWYGRAQDGKTTASGEKFNHNKPTAAHPTLPLGSTVEVTNLDNGKSTDVKINDRGPNVDGRAIDLSEKAAKQIGMKKDGVAPVKIETLDNANVGESSAAAGSSRSDRGHPPR